MLTSAIICPYLFGPTASAVAMAQAFTADSLATLVGIKWGMSRIPYRKNKTWMGSITFFLTATLASFIFIPFPQSIFLGFMGTLVEALSPPEWDNLTIPVMVGGITRLL